MAAASEVLRLEVQLSKQAAEDLAWLRRKLKGQCEGLVREGDGSYRVDLRAAGGKMRWFYGATADQALTRARDFIEGKIAPNRRIRHAA